MNTQVAIVVADISSLGTLTAVARSSGTKPTAIVVGTRELAEKVSTSDVSSVQWIETSGEIPAEAYRDAVAEVIKNINPSVVLSTNNASARPLVGAAASALDAIVTSAIIKVSFSDNQIEIEHYIADQRAVEVITTTSPVVGLVADGSEDVEITTAAEIIMISDAKHSPMTVVAVSAGESGGADLANADRVVGAGRGLTDKSQLELIDDLASALDAELACSLSLCDDYHWFEHGRVVGTSTQRISPRLYVSVGISGQPQHMTGVRAAKTIVAINNDPEAPIFKNCAYGIIGDLNKVVPALTEALKS